MTSRHKFSEEEKNQLFRDQHDALLSSCEAYDQGKLWEAKRLAASIYIMCHDPLPSKRKSLSKSLLGQMSLKNEIKFLSTSRDCPSNMIPWLPLSNILTIDNRGPHFVPTLESLPESWKWVSFTRWWDEVVFKTASGSGLSRKNLIFTMRSQDGGAHVDDRIRNDEYIELRYLVDPRLVRGKSPDEKNWTINFFPSLEEAKKGKKAAFEPIPGAHSAVVRQIAFEFLKSVGSGLLSKAKSAQV